MDHFTFLDFFQLQMILKKKFWGILPIELGATSILNNFYIFRQHKITTDLFPAAAAAAKSLQSCPTLCNPIDGSPPGSTVPGILQARTLEWVAISFSNACKWKVKVKSLSCIRLLGTPWTAAYQAPPSMGFSRQEYWSGMSSPSPIKNNMEIFKKQKQNYHMI